MPQELNRAVEKEIKQGGYATKSEFFRDILRMWFERKILKELREAEREIASGGGKALKSLKDLR